ncbi:NAD(P)-binding protein [Poronia punctata]|nr:NAD(P)-binding protein [Poronia punctata]
MSDQLVVVITSVSRGIGYALAELYLARSNCTVVGGYRDENAPGVSNLKTMPRGEGSKLVLVKMESAVPADAARAVEDMKATGIDRIDILIANAGISPPITSLERVDLDEVASTFKVNSLGPLALYQACYALLKASSSPKFVPISSAAGSLGPMHGNGAWVAPAYCISKATLNWIALGAHCGNEWLVSFAVNPGLVATDMGNKTAAYLGLDKAPHTQEYSAERIITLIDNATRETTSGKFLDAISGKQLPW